MPDPDLHGIRGFSLEGSRQKTPVSVHLCVQPSYWDGCAVMYMSPSLNATVQCFNDTTVHCYYREYLLAVLLHLTLELLRGYPPPDKDSSLAGSLAPMLLKVYIQ